MIQQKKGNQTEFTDIPEKVKPVIKNSITLIKTNPKIEDFNLNHSMLVKPTGTPEEEVNRLTEVFEENEVRRYKSYRRELNGFKRQILSMTDICQFVVEEDDFIKLYGVAEKCFNVSKNVAIEYLFVGAIGQFAVSKFLTGSDKAFWEHEKIVENRPNRFDQGMDIPGLKLDVKSSMLKRETSNYALLDYTLSVKEHLMGYQSTYVQSLVAFMQKEKTAMVYITGWANADMFARPGEQVGTVPVQFQDMFSLCTFQLNPIPPFLHINSHNSLTDENDPCSIRPWRYFDFDSTMGQVMPAEKPIIDNQLEIEGFSHE
jgi:hypothetical protein